MGQTAGDGGRDVFEEGRVAPGSRRHARTKGVKYKHLCRRVGGQHGDGAGFELRLTEDAANVVFSDFVLQVGKTFGAGVALMALADRADGF